MGRELERYHPRKCHCVNAPARVDCQRLLNAPFDPKTGTSLKHHHMVAGAT
jgi:hypothetical protein